MIRANCRPARQYKRSTRHFPFSSCLSFTFPFPFRFHCHCLFFLSFLAFSSSTSMDSEITNTVLFMKYFSAVGLVAMVYDHVLTAHVEMQVVWLNKKVSLLSKLAFGVNRYMTEGVIAYTVYVLSGAAQGLDNARFLWVFGGSAIVVGAISQAIIVLRIYDLWDQRKRVANALIYVFVVCIGATVMIGFVTEVQLKPGFSEILGICVINVKPKILPVLFGVQSFFDVLIISFAVYNALESPRRSHIELISSLQRDGLTFLLVLFALRTAYLVSSIVGNAGQCFVIVSTCWAFSAILSLRLNLRLDGLALNRDSVFKSEWDLSDWETFQG
ncbi:hypothetical protein DFH07DRAFT_793369 [Mycena maculata]|uniref:DUF6533 domain-containing protein n=1 Tax=Mycena maculata TaxID=230809 RepID=A0AAD7K8S9_9AGAR|nr:hypothetical protein DFH07DRAFT_793369 [Mycena maculata]